MCQIHGDVIVTAAWSPPVRKDFVDNPWMLVTRLKGSLPSSASWLPCSPEAGPSPGLLFLYCNAGTVAILT